MTFGQKLMPLQVPSVLQELSVKLKIKQFSWKCDISEYIRADVFALTIHSAVGKHGKFQKESLDIHYEKIDNKQNGLGKAIKINQFPSVRQGTVTNSSVN